MWLCFVCLILCFWESNLYSRFLLFAFWYMLSILRTQSSVPIFTWEWDNRLDCSLPLLTLFPHQVTSISSLSLLFSTQLCESLSVFQAVENTWGTDYWLDLSLSFWFCLLSSWPPLSPPPSSLLCVTPWISLRGPNCGKHIGKWLLASLLSLLLIHPLLLLITSISLLPLLFSM